jgi:hypothetical protein
MIRKVYIQTHGCQMNEYDSARMLDAMRELHGAEVTEDPASADLLLLNTCSIREKAQEKVFSLLGRWRALKELRPEIIIGVGGCVASQEGAALRERAPFVDIVFGPQTLHRLPALIQQVRGNRAPLVDISFPEIEKFDRLPEPRAQGASAFVSVMEGCSKYCSFCVVPYTRGEEISRPFDDVIAEVAGLAAQGVKEINLLGQNVNAYRGPMHDGDDGRSGAADPLRRRGGWHRAHPFHDFPPGGVLRPADPGLCRPAEAGQSSASAGAERLRPHPGADEARTHDSGIQVQDPPPACPASGPGPVLGLHCRLPRRDRRRP